MTVRPRRTAASPAARPGLSDGTLVVVAVLCFAAALHYAYRTQISPTFSYQGLTYRSPTLLGQCASLVIACSTALLLPRRIRKPSDLVLWIVFIMAVLPAMLVAQYSEILSSGESVVLAIHMGFALGLARLVSRVSPHGFVPTLPRSWTKYIWGAFIAFAIIVYVLLVAFFGVELKILALTEVYAVRDEFRASSVALPGIGYILPLVFSVINPILMIRGFYGRRWLLLLFGAFGQVLIYTTTGRKGVLFSTVALLAFAWMFSRAKELSGARILSYATLGIVGAVVIDRITYSLWATSLMVRRLIVVPGILTVAYVSVFKDRPKTNFADSILPFLENPYSDYRNASNLVGQLFLGRVEANANVSLFGHGYLSWDYPGMYIEAAVLGLLLALTNEASKGLPLHISCLIFVMPAIAVSSASIFTTILTHGFLASILAASSLPRDGWAPQGEPEPPTRRTAPRPRSPQVSQ